MAITYFNWDVRSKLHWGVKYNNKNILIQANIGNKNDNEIKI